MSDKAHAEDTLKEKIDALKTKGQTAKEVIQAEQKIIVKYLDGFTKFARETMKAQKKEIERLNAEVAKLKAIPPSLHHANI